MPTVTTPLRGLTVARAVAGLLAATAVLLTAAPSSAMARNECLGAGAAPSVQTLHRAAGAVICLVNAERARHGLRALRSDADLRQAAGRHSRNMVRRGFFSHVTPSGAGLNDRLRRSGYIHGKRARHVGEALAWGTGTPATPNAIVAGWIASPPHHRILLGRDFREVGVGVAIGTPQASTGRRGGLTYTFDTGVIGG
jgi:uncharacterized protein YkwD